MPIKNIIPGQKVASDKVQLSRELRQEMTPAETILWQNLRGHRLNGFHFRRQHIISGYIVDFFCHKAGLVIEADGGIHIQQKEYDALRDNVFNKLGLQVLHFRNDEVISDLPAVLKKIANHMCIHS